MSLFRHRRLVDRLGRGLCGLATLLALVPLVSVLVWLVSHGARGLSFALFTELPKPFGEVGGGVGQALLGTGIMVGVALLLSMPLGILAGIALAEGGKSRFVQIVRFVADVLAGAPSIAVGVFVYTAVVMPMHGFSAFAGALALAVLMLPTITRSTEELLRLVPIHLREAGLALGLPAWRVTLSVTLKSALPGVATGIMLAVARAAGETAPLLFTAFGSQYWAWNLSEPMAALPLQIFTLASSPFEAWHQQAWAAALVLVTLVLLANLGARFVTRRARGGMAL